METSATNFIVEDEDRRRSTREQKQRSVNMTPVKVRYDMESVPLVDRPMLQFWDDVTVWPPRSLKDPPPPILPSPRTELAQPRPPDASPTVPTPVPQSQPIHPASPLPNSVIWKPPTRKDWEDSVSELVAVCTSAALRRHTGPVHKFTPPLSREYIRDRIDIDDPLRGYQIRHASGGWLQGFCLWTNFTTWTHFFTWDSLHPQAGLLSNGENEDYTLAKDTTGELAQRLQALPRSGDPSDSGIVFDSVAEIALLGGLGCGELLLRMALEDILKCGKYKFVVLQATKGSRPFYERFGFQRVGAVCRYATSSATDDAEKSTVEQTAETTAVKTEHPSSTDDDEKEQLPQTQQSQATLTPATVPTLDNPIQGYRHWTHANESQHSLDLHGGPSYMMCLELPEEPMEGLNLLEKLAPAFVTDKPVVQSIGATTPTSKRKLKRQSSTGGSTPPLPSLHHSKSSPALTSISEEWSNVTNKRRKVSMDKLDLGTAAASAAYTVPPIPPYVPPTASRATTPPRNSAGKAYSQLLAKAVANTTLSKAAAAAAAAAVAGNNSKKSRSSSSSSSAAVKRALPPVSSIAPASESPNQQAVPHKGIQRIDRTTLVKQKVKSYPRDREHFYNKVVQPKNSPAGSTNYYFVLHYNDKLNMVTLCPMTPKGVLSGKRQGRPRYQCIVQNTSANWITAPTRLYDPVPAFMVMKTPLVAQEAWDILTDGGGSFE